MYEQHVDAKGYLIYVLEVPESLCGTKRRNKAVRFKYKWCEGRTYTTCGAAGHLGKAVGTHKVE